MQPARFIAALLACAACAIATAAPRHPLDALSWQEHWRVLEILEESGKLTGRTRFSRIALEPPPKADVLARKPAEPLARRAQVRIKEGPAAIEALVDIDRGRLVEWHVIEGVEPAWLLEEFLGAPVQAVKNHPDFIEAVRRRGIESTRFLNCRAMPIGNHEEPRYRGRRVAIVRCDPVSGVRNTFVRRIEGLIATVDVNTNEVLEIADEELVPTPDTTAEYDRESLGKLREFPTPIELSQPEGASFTLNGSAVEWDKWHFHVRHDQRVGLVLSELTWNDGGRERSVMFEGHLSEIFVPYMDPRRDWYTRTLLDAGEYSMGGLAGPLTPGVDCPGNAQYLSGLVVQDNGRPQRKENVICLFERTRGDMSWRHASEGRAKRELVVRMIADLGNYDYVFDWVLESDGQFRIAIGATGIVAVQMSKQPDATSSGPERADRYGRFVDRHVIAVNHDHYFSFRLDLDVDGPKNSFIHDTLVTERLPESSPRRSLWVSRERVLERESEAKLNAGMHTPSLWRVINPERRNALGYPVGFQLMLGHSAHTLLSEDDVPRQRAGFIDHDLWVTAHDPDERYAAGEYAVLSPPGEGLPKWTRADRPIAGEDIVVWPTVGMHHKVRAEDWPVMPVLWHEIVIRPFDFFDRNPALDLGGL